VVWGNSVSLNATPKLLTKLGELIEFSPGTQSSIPGAIRRERKCKEVKDDKKSGGHFQRSRLATVPFAFFLGEFASITPLRWHKATRKEFSKWQGKLASLVWET